MAAGTRRGGQLTSEGDRTRRFPPQPPDRRWTLGGHYERTTTRTDGLIEVEAEVDTNRNGQVWSVKLVDNGVTAWSGTRTTVAPSGSFSVEKRIVNRSGLDKITVRATRGSTVCSTSVSL